MVFLQQTPLGVDMVGLRNLLILDVAIMTYATLSLIKTFILPNFSFQAVTARCRKTW